MKEEQRQYQRQSSKQTQQSRSVLEAVNNVNRKYCIGRQEYLFLIKKQKQKNYCTLYITDCQAQFWIKKIDQLFLLKLKQNMSINTELKVFAQHFANNLKENSSIFLKDDEMKIEIELKIGQGLTMNCQFFVQSSISASQNPHDFKMILRNFLKQLYDAKQAQIQEQKKKWIKYMEDDCKDKAPKNEKSDPIYVKEVLNPLKKDIQDVKPKNRNLMNPNLKKRQVKGIQFSGDV